MGTCIHKHWIKVNILTLVSSLKRIVIDYASLKDIIKYVFSSRIIRSVNDVSNSSGISPENRIVDIHRCVSVIKFDGAVVSGISCRIAGEGTITNIEPFSTLHVIKEKGPSISSGIIIE